VEETLHLRWGKSQQLLIIGHAADKLEDMVQLYGRHSIKTATVIGHKNKSTPSMIDYNVNSIINGLRREIHRLSIAIEKLTKATSGIAKSLTLAEQQRDTPTSVSRKLKRVPGFQSTDPGPYDQVLFVSRPKNTHNILTQSFSNNFSEVLKSSTSKIARLSKIWGNTTYPKKANPQCPHYDSL